MSDAYFSPGNDCFNIIKSAINNATTELDIAMYQFTDSKIWECLRKATSRGVVIRLILDKQSSKRWSAIWVRFLLWLSFPKIITAISNSSGLMHHSFMIVDGAYVFTGSYNWTAVARKRNNENMIVSSDSATVLSYVNRFEYLWSAYYMGNVLISGGPLGQPSSGDLRNCDVAKAGIPGVCPALPNPVDTTKFLNGAGNFSVPVESSPCNAANIATAINGVAETTPLAADEFPFYKTAGAALKKVLWSTIISTLFTAYDTLAAGVKGWCPALPNPTDTSKYLNGAGAFTVPPVGAGTGIIIGSNAPSATALQFNNGYTYASRWRALAAATLTNLGLIVWSGTAGIKLVIGIYADNAGAPGALLRQTAEYTLITADKDDTEITVSLSSPLAITKGTKYWLAFHVDTATNFIGYATGGTSKAVYHTCAYNATLLNPFGSVDGTTQRLASYGLV